MAAAASEDVDLVVVGPEVPLVLGLADALAGRGHPLLRAERRRGPARGLKAFCQGGDGGAGVPTAAYEVGRGGRRRASRDHGLPGGDQGRRPRGRQGRDHRRRRGGGARRRSRRCSWSTGSGPSGSSSRSILDGEELSLLALCDGERAIPLASAQDYKRIFDGERGRTPAGWARTRRCPAIDADRAASSTAQIHQPVARRAGPPGHPFHGVLYAGLMLTAAGPSVLEFNVRFGDPETQAILPRLGTDLLELLLAATEPGGLSGASSSWSARTAVTVVLASAGYPGTYSSGDVITGLDAIDGRVEVTHAGTARDASDESSRPEGGC